MKVNHTLIFITILFALVACQEEPRNLQPLRTETQAVASVAPTLMNTATPEMTATLQPTNSPTPLPTLTVAPTNTPTAVPTNTSTPIPQSPTPSPQLGLSCPDPAPTKPDYQLAYLSPDPWPTPSTTQFEPHFWLIDPIGNGRKPFEQAYYPYGWDGGGRFLLHNGADMPKELGTPLLAVADGTVIVAQTDSEEMFGWRCDWYGQLVILELEQRWQDRPIYILYGHIQNIQVEVGERVTQGDRIAEIGVEGVSLVPHLHLEVRVGENDFTTTQNPILWMQPTEDFGILAGRLIDPEKRPWQGIRVTIIDPSGDEPQFISTFTYLDDPQHIINPDEQLAENFVFADLRPGFYTLFAQLQGVDYRVPVEIKAGEITAVEIMTEAYKTPTPQP